MTAEIGKNFLLSITKINIYVLVVLHVLVVSWNMLLMCCCSQCRSDTEQTEHYSFKLKLLLFIPNGSQIGSVLAIVVAISLCHFHCHIKCVLHQIQTNVLCHLNANKSFVYDSDMAVLNLRSDFLG